MNNFVPFGTDGQSMYLISTRFLKDKIDGVSVPKFQLDYICNRTHPLHKNSVKLCCEVNYMRWVNQNLELQEW